MQRLLDELWRFLVASLVLPAAYVEVVFVVTLGLAFLRLVLLAEVAAARLVARQRVIGYQLAHGDEVAQVDRLVKLCVESFLRAGDEEVGLELLADFLYQLESFLQAFGRAAHAHVLPHDVAKLLVD